MYYFILVNFFKIKSFKSTPYFKLFTYELLVDEKYPLTIYGKFIVFCRGVFRKYFKNLKTALNIYGKKTIFCTGVL